LPSAQTIQKIAKSLGVSMEEVLKEKKLEELRNSLKQLWNHPKV
jgi:transcriptional regulator with XRE-family HTH domain